MYVFTHQDSISLMIENASQSSVDARLLSFVRPFIEEPFTEKRWVMKCMEAWLNCVFDVTSDNYSQYSQLLLQVTTCRISSSFKLCFQTAQASEKFQSVLSQEQISLFDIDCLILSVSVSNMLRSARQVHLLRLCFEIRSQLSDTAGFSVCTSSPNLVRNYQSRIFEFRRYS